MAAAGGNGHTVTETVHQHGTWTEDGDTDFCTGAEISPIITGNEVEHVTFFLGRENLIATQHPGMAKWRVGLFAFLTRNAQPATKFFNIPPDRVFEIGAQIEL